MRFVVYGAGAIGGVVGARLHQAGHEVALVARGAHLEAIQTHGLTLTTPAEQVTVRIPAASDPGQLGVGAPDDIVLLAVKSQDTAGALDSLRTAAAGDVPIVCLQNGVENERVCARRFADVYGAVVMMPADHLRPGHVEAYGARASGIIDVGRYPAGVDERCEAICAALSGARIHSEPSSDVMRRKYAKLLRNLGNAVGALFGDAESARAELTERLRDEARAALDAAEIEYHDEVVDDVGARMKLLDARPIGGRERAGSSSWQSLARGAGTIETDYLNGEIVLLGRLHGVPTPFNEAICRLADDAVRGGARPGELSIDELFGAVRS
jgi:2-dehydropantoate 2-reductase